MTAPDHFMDADGLRFAGTHLLLDLWEASRLADRAAVESALRTAAEVAGATLLRMDLHTRPSCGGITGVAILAESHISIHTWPEHGYAAIDLFMCGDARPHRAIAVVRHTFDPSAMTIVEHKRGIMPC